MSKREDTSPTQELSATAREGIQKAVKDQNPPPRCGLCLDTGYVFHDGPTPHKRIKAYCSCGQHIEVILSTIEDMKAYLRATGLELRITPGVLVSEWTVTLHSANEYNVGVAQDSDLIGALRKAVQSAMRRTFPSGG